MKAVLAASTLFFATSVFAAGVANLTGQWTIHNNIAGNESDQECKLVQQDNAITGTCKSAEGKDLAVTGIVDGKKVTWKYDSDFNGTPLTLTYTATLDESNKVSGTVDVQPFAVSGDFTATPLKEGSK
jgi:hypothetical protein